MFKLVVIDLFGPDDVLVHATADGFLAHHDGSGGVDRRRVGIFDTGTLSGGMYDDAIDFTQSTSEQRVVLATFGRGLVVGDPLAVGLEGVGLPRMDEKQVVAFAGGHSRDGNLGDVFAFQQCGGLADLGHGQNIGIIQCIQGCGTVAENLIDGDILETTGRGVSGGGPGTGIHLAGHPVGQCAGRFHAEVLHDLLVGLGGVGNGVTVPLGSDLHFGEGQLFFRSTQAGFSGHTGTGQVCQLRDVDHISGLRQQFFLDDERHSGTLGAGKTLPEVFGLRFLINLAGPQFGNPKRKVGRGVAIHGNFVCHCSIPP